MSNIIKLTRTMSPAMICTTSFRSCPLKVKRDTENTFCAVCEQLVSVRFHSCDDTLSSLLLLGLLLFSLVLCPQVAEGFVEQGASMERINAGLDDICARLPHLFTSQVPYPFLFFGFNTFSFK